MAKTTLDWIAFVLVIVGALNWLLYGLWTMDLVAYLPGVLATIVYVLVGLSGLYLIYWLSKNK